MLKYYYHIWSNRFAESLCRNIAWILPREIVMWCAIRVMAHATQGPYSATDATALQGLEAIRRWDDRWDEYPETFGTVEGPVEV